jgi:hypothetical protein
MSNLLPSLQRRCITFILADNDCAETSFLKYCAGWNSAKQPHFLENMQMFKEMAMMPP